MRTGYVYILTNKPDGVLFTGVTSDLVRRVNEHKEKAVAGFTKTYNLDKLVYYEAHPSIEEAVHREKSIKEASRAWKVGRIVERNPDWHDLYDEIAVQA
jgi:putative endonuclease